MCWQDVGKILRDLKPTGSTGFEGLVASLFEQVLDQPFVLSRAGDQPGGDAHNISGSVSIQAKRYAGNRSPNENEIVGDIDRVSRTFPNLDMYVLALSCPVAAQLQERLVPIRDETGIDIVTLTFDCDDSLDQLPDLGVLIFRHWSIIKGFHAERQNNGHPVSLAELLTDAGLSEDWINAQVSSRKIEVRSMEIERSLKEQTQTYSDTKRNCTSYLRRRLGLDESHGERFTFRISLKDSIPRRRYIGVLSEWLKTGDPVAYLEGEEGTGKSWVAADPAPVK